jgi:hypothetical protein
VQDGHHELPVETEHGTLTCTEAVGFSPAQTDPQTQHALLRIGVLGPRIVSDIQSWNADRSAGAGHCHERIQHRSRLLGSRLLGLALRFKAYAVNCRINFGNTCDLGDAVA